tara:strand:- start:2308 stop:2925 length:618 start_codon:yes stop_codon:yes gene_type:complete
MLVHFFKTTFFISLILTNILFINTSFVFADEKSKKSTKNNDTKSSFGAAVIDMQKVLSKSTAWTSLQKQVKEIEDSFKEKIKGEEESLKKEQENLRAQKSVLAKEQFKEKEEEFKAKVNKVQSKVQNARRELESTMARGMQIIQAEAVKHLKEIAAKEGYYAVFDASTTIIAADIINISDVVAEKINKTLPKINVERKKDKKGEN